MQDITKKKQGLENQEATPKLEEIKEAPASIKISKKVEIEQAPAPVKEEITEGRAKEAAPPVSSAAPAVSAKQEALEEIEDVLEEDLENIYFQMSPDKQTEFKEAGEKTASQIVLLLSEAKIKVKKILELVRNWLKIIPGINKFFLEQEAKIKTDKLLEIEEEGDTKIETQNQNKI